MPKPKHFVRRSKNYFRFGVEYTFVETRAREAGSAPGIRDVARILERKLNPWKAHNDGGALEVPSQPETDIEKHMAWVEKLFKEVGKRSFVARRVDREADGSVTYHGTGGGHIHVEIPLVGKTPAARQKCQSLYLRRLMELYFKNPFIGWFMNEFMDDDNATCIQHRIKDCFEPPDAMARTVREYVLGLKPVGFPYMNFLEAAGYGDHGIVIHRHGLAAKYRREGLAMTVEFRFFDAPRNLKQAREHIDLAKAIHCVALGKRKIPTPIVDWETLSYSPHRNSRWMKYATDAELLKREWTRFIRALGLDPKRYAKYYQNYLDRRDYGTLN